MTKRPKPPPLSPDNQIRAFMHCSLCIAENPGDVSPAAFARLSVGWTPRGLQVWCERHGANVCNVDFEGATHPAIVHRAGGNTEEGT